MDILNKNILASQEYLFTSDPASLYTELYPEFSINLFQYQGEDLYRYQEYLNQEKNIPCDFNKTIKIALDEYLKKVITEKDLLKIEEVKADEARRIQESIKVNKPKYDWLKSKLKGVKNDNQTAKR